MTLHIKLNLFNVHTLDHLNSSLALPILSDLPMEHGLEFFVIQQAQSVNKSPIVFPILNLFHKNYQLASKQQLRQELYLKKKQPLSQCQLPLLDHGLLLMIRVFRFLLAVTIILMELILLEDVYGKCNWIPSNSIRLILIL